MKTERAVLAGDCFLGVQQLVRALPGVVGTRVRYTGGDVANGLRTGRVVTQGRAAGPFWEAGPEHQDGLQRNPEGYTCHFVLPHWVLAEKNGAIRT